LRVAVMIQIGVVTGYGFMAMLIILIMPLVTEIYELRKFMIERASVEPGSPVQVDLTGQVDLPVQVDVPGQVDLVLDR